MNPQEPYLPSSHPHEAASPVPASPPAPRGPSSFERGMARFTDEMLRERRTDRRWRVFFRLAWLILFIIVAWSLLVGRGHGGAPSGPHTALVEVRGEIDSEGQASAENLVAGLKGAFEDADSQAVVLRINSPGGSPVQAGIVNDEIRRLKAKHKK